MRVTYKYVFNYFLFWKIIIPWYVSVPFLSVIPKSCPVYVATSPSFVVIMPLPVLVEVLPASDWDAVIKLDLLVTFPTFFKIPIAVYESWVLMISSSTFRTIELLDWRLVSCK